MTTLYYDPQLDVHHRLPVSAAVTTAYYAASQVPDDAKRLFLAGCTSLGIDGDVDGKIKMPLHPSRAYGSALVLAREWGMTDLEARLVTAIEASYEPTWNSELGEFTWGMGLDEEHPRGQFNAFLAAAEASGPGMWSKLSEAPLERCPQVVDVDFPTVALSRAEWIAGSLHLHLVPLQEDPNRWTTFRIVDVEPRLWYLTGIDGATMDVRPDCVIVRVPLINGSLEFTPGSY